MSLSLFILVPLCVLAFIGVCSIALFILAAFCEPEEVIEY